jgi:arginyl-tRNA synthetase
MKPIWQQLDSHFRAAIKDAFGFDDTDPVIAPSANPQFGDYQANCAMALAKRVGETTGAKTNPRAVAEQIKAKLNLGDMSSEVSIAGPGFINVKLAPAWLANQCATMLTDARLGVPVAAKRDTVVVDYPSINAAKEMHIGHLRPSTIGDSLSRVLEFLGHTIIRQNHLGDWGTAFGMLLTYLKESARTGDAPISDIEQCYKAAKTRFDESPEFANESRQAVVRLQTGAPEEMARWQQILELSRKHMDEMFALLGIKVTRADERGESFYNPKLAETVNELVKLGVAEESDGAIVVWVKGFEAPLIIRKSDGGFGYATTDLAAVRFRTRELHATRVIVGTDVRQKQHFEQFTDAARRANWLDGVAYEHVMFGSINGEDGKAFKARSGDAVKLRDVLYEAIERAKTVDAVKSQTLGDIEKNAIARTVGIGAVKYYDLVRDRLTDYKFDWDAMMAMDGNTAPYLQMAHARICGIFRKADASRGAFAVTELNDPTEQSLAKLLLRFGETVDAVARDLKPHYLCTYLFDLSGRFNSFFEACPVISSPEPTRSSRLALCDLTARVLKQGLNLLGIDAPEKM